MVTAAASSTGGEHHTSLHFDVALDTFGSPLESIASYETIFQPQSSEVRWKKLVGPRIAGVKLSASPQHLPGGVCFWLDVKVYTKPKKTDHSSSQENTPIPLRRSHTSQTA